MPLFNPAIPPQEDWQAPTLLAGWTVFSSAYNSPGYWKDSMGVVHLRGLIKPGTYNSSAFTLPVGYRPEKTEILAAISYGSGGATMSQLNITSAGAVLPVNGGATWLCLDGATFRAI